MPSARELLEQADALMRRNRSPLMDDIPVLTDSVPEARHPPAARLRPALPQSQGRDSIPMLTERVPGAPSPAPATPAPAKPDAVIEEGEPSDWLQLGGDEPSVIGDAPDSIAMVPPFEQEASEEIEVQAPAEVEASFDAELAGEASNPKPAVEIASPAPPVPVPHPADTAIDIAAPAQVAMPEWELDTIIDEREEVAPVHVEADEAVQLSMPPVVTPAPVEVSEPVEMPAPFAISAPVEVPATAAQAVEVTPSAAERQAEEDARWASMAEEIRMQVLQRIDLFTDTGLRDQLGTRLQPIVDRASADLVATINQHVGELLRAYVAEAIEREIENWRHAQR